VSRTYNGELACPACGASQSKVTNTYGNRDGDRIRRRRECLSCAHRYTTVELVASFDGTAAVLGRVEDELARLRKLMMKVGLT